MRVNPSVQNNVSATKPESKKTEDLKSTSRAEKLKQMDGIEKSAKSRTIEDSSKTDISAKAKDFSKAYSVAASTPDVREDKIAEIKKRLAEGTYKVDNDAVADKMISEHMSF
jgi:negative regulator of flagellin synthesis FlgM